MKKVAIIMLILCTAVFAQTKGTFTDPRDKKKYNTVEKDGYIRMDENLKFNAKGSKCPGEDEVKGDCAKWEESCDPYCDKVCVKHKPPTAKQLQEVKANCEKEGRLYPSDMEKSTCPSGWDLLHDGYTRGHYSFADHGYPYHHARCGQDAPIKLEKGSFTDSRDKKKYNTIKIGEQIWMSENLSYKDKDSKCFNDKEANCTKYGRLYNWETAMKACPADWHLPVKSEWEALIKVIGGESQANTLKAKNWAGGKGKDKFGFNGLPGGEIKEDWGSSDGFGGWWSATNNGAKSAWHFVLPEGDNAYLSFRDNAYKTTMYSVRCIQGPAPEQPVAQATQPAAQPAAAPAAKPAAASNDPSKAMYCVTYMMGKIAGCTEMKDIQEQKSKCEAQAGTLKMMGGKLEWTATKPSGVNCNKGK